jgi:hypothetical protein
MGCREGNLALGDEERALELAIGGLARARLQ